MSQKTIISAQSPLIYQTVKFQTTDKRTFTFEVVHNLHLFGLNIADALVNWSARTDKLKQQSFMDYVKSKDPENIVCLSKRQYDILSKKE